MKKRTLIVLSAVLTVLTLLTLASCGKKFALATPEKLNVDENNLLSWGAVESARTYSVEVKTSAGEVALEKSTRKTSYSLSDLDEGDYVIRIMAVGGEDNDKISDWSETLLFHRDYESGCEYISINSNTEYRIVSGKRATGNVRIDATYRGKPVTEIAENAFKGNRNILSVTLGENIRSIGENAFYNCGQLTSVTVPDRVSSIGASAFQGCRALTDVNIPLGVDSVPEYCFAYCRALTSVTIGDQIKTISDSAFLGTALTEVVIPDSVVSIGGNAFSSISGLTTVRVGKNVAVIGAEAFRDNTALTTVIFADDSVLTTLGNHCFSGNILLSAITLPQSLTDIGSGCFYGCTELGDTAIPAAVTHIGANAFNATKLFTGTEDDFVYSGNWLVAVKNLQTLVTVTAGDFKADTVGIADSCFAGAALLESVTLSDSVKTIGQRSFSQCPKLEEFASGKSLTTIQPIAFAACNYLYKLRLNEGLKEIGDYAFYYNSLLNNKTTGSADDTIIPNSVERIGVDAFYMTALWNEPSGHIIYAGNWVVGYEKNEQTGKIAFSEATLKSSVVGIADYAFKQCTTLTSLGNLSRCTKIGEGAFYGCTSLRTAVLHPRITKIPAYTFYKCSDLFRVEFPLMLETIGRSAFYKCTSLNTLSLWEDKGEDGIEEVTPFLKSIGDYAFYGCENLVTVRCNDELEEIGQYAFSRCTKLGELRLSGKMTEIRAYTFAFSALPQVTIGQNVTKIASRAFYKCSQLATVVVPDSVTTIEDYAFYKCTALTSLTLGKSVETIGDYAFYNVKALQELRLPAGIRQLGRYAFKSAEQLKTVIIPATVTELGNNAFYGCKRATFYIEEGADRTGWNSRWNSSNRPVVNDATLSAEKDYVVSVKTSETTVLNKKSLANDIAPLNAPERPQYDFAGWQRQDGTVIATIDLAAEPAGTVLTAVWTPAKEAPAEESPAEETPATDSEESK